MSTPRGGTPSGGGSSSNDARTDDDDDDDDDALAGLPPDHPLLERAQRALRVQLLDSKRELEEKIKEKGDELNKEKRRREQIGVELYTTQQQLAKLQTNLDKTHDAHAALEATREQSESDLRELQEWFETRVADGDDARRMTDQHQLELDSLKATLRQVEQHNEKMKSDIAVTRRATYAAEETVAQLEKDKQDQDLLIDNLQDTLRKLHERCATHDAQLIAQRKETTRARETLEEAAQEMDAINFEKKQLAAQWKASLVGVSKRDDALKAAEGALRDQAETRRAVESETEGYKKNIREAEAENEQMSAILRKVEKEAEALTKDFEKCRTRKEVLTAQHEKLTTTLEETEATLDAARKRAKALKAEEKDADDALGRAREDRRAIDERVLSNLGEQSTVEKGANQTVAATRATRKDIKAAETAVTNLQNDIAKVRVDALNAQTHVAALQETMEALDASLKDKTRTIEKYELEIKRRADEINKRVKDVGRLNLELDKHKGDGDDGENLGPLEATIKSMHKEADATAKENKELQRRWVGHQTELVALVNENNTLTEKTQRLRAERTILERRKTRLDANHERQEGEVRDLDRATEHMRKDTLRINELSAKHLKRKDALLTDNHVLETEIVGELKDLEVAAVELEGKIEAAVEEKRVTLANVVEAERQIMLWERKIQLEKETQAALDPDVGNDVVNAMRKEINRMEHKHGELKRRQEKLIQEMEKAIYKRQLIQTKALSAAARNEGGSSSSSASLKGRAAKKDEMTKAGLKKACAALKKSIRETESGGAEADARIERLEDDGVRAATEADRFSAEIERLRVEESTLRADRDAKAREREVLQLEAAKSARMRKRFEDVVEGRHRVLASDEDVVADLEKARRRREKLLSAVEDACEAAPHLWPSLERALTLLSI